MGLSRFARRIMLAPNSPAYRLLFSAQSPTVIHVKGAVMARTHPEAASTPYLRHARRVAWGVAWLILVAAIIDFLLVTYRKYGHVDADAYSIFWSRREWLWVHLAGGTLAVLLGALQFLTPLRNAWPRIHRWTGRLYLLAMLVASLGVAALIATSPAGFGLRLAFAAMGLAWLFTGTMGFIAIRRKRLQIHRRWMVRNYIITFAFVTFRAMLMIPGVMALAPPAVIIPTLLWLSWVVPILAYEMGAAAIHWRAAPVLIPQA
jgi:hypothetical protein